MKYPTQQWRDRCVDQIVTKTESVSDEGMQCSSDEIAIYTHDYIKRGTLFVWSTKRQESKRNQTKRNGALSLFADTHAVQRSAQCENFRSPPPPRL